MKQLKILVEKHADGYVAYPIGLNGIVVGQGDTNDDALADVKSAIRFHVATWGAEVSAVDASALALADAYQERGIVSPKYAGEAVHIALATAAEVALLVSRNFRYIVHYGKIRLFHRRCTQLAFSAVPSRSTSRRTSATPSELRYP